MNIRIKFDGASFAIGVLIAAVTLGAMSAWWLAIAPVFLLDLPGPRLSYKTGEGVSFKWWAPAA